jgi:hypothetical protein
MDNLHTVIRSIRGETKHRRDHLSVFREFLSHLDHITKSRARAARAGKGGQRTKAGPSNRRHSGK